MVFIKDARQEVQSKESIFIIIIPYVKKEQFT
jgi:hypothetical protein